MNKFLTLDGTEILPIAYKEYTKHGLAKYENSVELLPKLNTSGGYPHNTFPVSP